MRAGLQVLATVALIATIFAGASLAGGPRVVVVSAAHVDMAAHVGRGTTGNTPTSAVDWIVFGGGSKPADSQVTIESDVKRAAATFGGNGRVYFAGGSRARCVQVLQRAKHGDPLLRELGAFFQPRAGRSSRYRQPALKARASTAAAVLADVRGQLAAPITDPLFVYAAGHGEIGKTARENLVALWAGSQVTVGDLAHVLDRARSKRVVRIVATTCYSGGFGELVFRDATADRGPARTARCGLFAAPWDLESTGCDADPDRRLHHGYGAYFLAALRGETRLGAALAPSSIDFDGDGEVSLLEAHTRVRIASPAADVPTSTSERWLRHVAPLSGPASPTDLPEEDAVIAALAAKLGLREPMKEAEAAHKAAQKANTGASDAIAALQRTEDDAYHAVSAALLGRWPVLDDPWHPEFAATMKRNRAHIQAFIAGSPLWHRYKLAVKAVDAASNRRDVVRIRAALQERLHRAVQNKLLAGRLTARADEDWLTWKRLLRCERYVPKLAPRP